MSNIWTRFRLPSSSSSNAAGANSQNALNINFNPDPQRPPPTAYSAPFMQTPQAPPAPQHPAVIRLRSLFGQLPHSHWYRYSDEVRGIVLKELFMAFWGPYGNWFVNLEDPACKESFSIDWNLTRVQKGERSGYGMQDLETEQEIVGGGRCCEFVFDKGDVGYRCRDCALDDSCVMCAQCFHASDHTNHIVTFHIAHHPGGYCDCGDAECWRPNMVCRLHPRSSYPAVPVSPSPSSNSSTGTTSPQIPPALKESMTATVGYALDFVLETLDLSPDDTTNPVIEADITKVPTSDPLHAPPAGYPSLFNAPPDPIFAVVMWNDDKHSFQDVVDVVVDGTGTSVHNATQIAERINTNGRAVVDYSTDFSRLLYISRLIGQIDAGVTIRRASDTFREEIAGTILEWLVDLTTARLGGHSLATREVIANQMFATRPHSANSAQQAWSAGNQSVEHDEFLQRKTNLSRLDYLLCYHTRLWREPRLQLKQIYVSLFRVSPSVRIQIATHFAHVYHRIVDDYLLVDREGDTSIKSFSEQLFTVPSVAASLTQHTQLVPRIFMIITSFFNNQLSEGGKHVIIPPTPTEALDVNSFPFRSKRFQPLFSDLRSIFTVDGGARVLAADTKVLSPFVDMCQLFSGINPNTRASVTHIEYETDAWVSVFNVTHCIARCVKAWGEMYTHTDARKLGFAIAYVAQRTSLYSRTRLDASGKPGVRGASNLPHFHKLTFAGSVFDIVMFDVLQGWISFHNPMHWLLAELVKNVDLLSDDQGSGAPSLRGSVFQHVGEQGLLITVEFPLRVVVLVAQVRAGLWVRNGFAIRGQLMHYREFMLRELCYDQDLFLLQIALVLLDPQTILVSMLDRFQLLWWFQGKMVHAHYDSSHLAVMLEEFLYVLIACLTETGHARGLRSAGNVRREVIHALALGACSYSDLCKRTSERVVEEKGFDHTLMEVANFKPPVSLTDVGMYELKDEYFEEVDHFFYHFSRNKREEMEGILKGRLKKTTGIDDPVIVPKRLVITKGPFVSLSNIWRSQVLLQIVFWAIFNFLERESIPSYADVVVDQALHLVMCALVEQPEAFTQLAARKLVPPGNTLLTALCILEASDRFKGFRSQVSWCLDVFQQHVPTEVHGKRRANDSSASRAAQLEAVKKRAAKARQDAIMKEFAVAQKTFMDNNFLNEEEEDDDMEEEYDQDMDDDEEEEPLQPVGTCIVCQEELDQSMAFGMLCSVQPSRIVRTTPSENIPWLQDALLTPSSLDRPVDKPARGASLSRKGKEPESSKEEAPEAVCPGFPIGHTRYGLHTKVCGHMMHIACFNTYTASVEHRQHSQTTRNHPENTARKEFVCPLCKSLGNALLPVQDQDWSEQYFQHSNLTLADWLRQTQTDLLRSYQDRSFDTVLCSNGTGEFACWESKNPVSFEAYQSQTAADFEWLMGDTIVRTARFYADMTGHLRSRVPSSDLTNDPGAYLPEELCMYSLCTMEIAQRGAGVEGSTIADSMSETQSRVIRGLLYTLYKMAGSPFPMLPDGGRSVFRRVLGMRLLPEWTGERGFAYPLLLRDPLTLLVETAAVAPEILHYVVVLAYYAALARAAVGIMSLLSKLPSTPHFAPFTGPHEEIFGDVMTTMPMFFRHAPILQQNMQYIVATYYAQRINQLLYIYTLPFLRRAAMLVRAVRPTRFPKKTSADLQTSEYSRLLELLNIPQPSLLQDSQAICNIMDGWVHHYSSWYNGQPEQCDIVLDHPSIYHLAKLPEQLDTLFVNPKLFICFRCNTMPQEPAICLFCGTVCCLQSHCCTDAQAEAGECNMHMRDCGGPVGLYFLVKKCSILYLHAGNGTFGQVPYVDVHGEVDSGMRRQRLQHLHALRYEELRKQWLTHGIPAIVARKLESAIDHGGWGTL